MSSDREIRRIGWIGTGIMGAPMCGHLLDAGYEAKVFNRTRAKAEPLFAKGAEWADSPREASESVDAVFSIVGFPEDVRQVYFGDDGILSGAGEGAIVIDMTTTEPSLAIEIAEKAAAKGASAVDAPVSGGDVGARNAALSIMVGGEEGAVKAVMPLFEVMGKQIVHQGPAGSGQHTKMCNQIVIAGTMIGVSESLLYAYKAGLDPATVLESIGGGAAACWSLDNYLPRMIRRDFAPGFIVEHYIKDLGIAVAEAERMGLDLPGLALAKSLYLKLEELGHGRSGTHALILALEELSGYSPE